MTAETRPSAVVRVFILPAVAAILISCRPGADFNVAVRVIDQDTGRPIPDAWVFVTARVQADPPFEEPYDKPLAGTRAKTDASGMARLGKVEGLAFRGEPKDVLWRAIEDRHDERRGVRKRRIAGVEGGTVFILARGYGGLARPFGLPEDPGYQARLKEKGRYDGVLGGLGFKGEAELIELNRQDLARGVTVELKMQRPEDPAYLQGSLCPEVLYPAIWGATSKETGTSRSEKTAVYDFILQGLADLGEKAHESCGHTRPSDFAAPEFKKEFIAHKPDGQDNHETVVHEWMTRQALALLPEGYDEAKQYAREILAGVKAEDEGLRPRNHFHNPHDPGNAMIGGEPALKWEAIGYPDNPGNEWDWADALRYYREGDKARAYKALGHVLHVLEDLSVPMHTHVIAHDKILHRSAARFEAFFSQLAKEGNGQLPPGYAAGARRPKAVKDLKEHFDGLAKMTFGRLESDGNVNDVGAFYAWERNRLGKQVREPDAEAVRVMGERLLPAGIEHAAGLMAHYAEQVHPRLSAASVGDATIDAGAKAVLIKESEQNLGPDVKQVIPLVGEDGLLRAFAVETSSALELRDHGGKPKSSLSLATGKTGDTNVFLRAAGPVLGVQFTMGHLGESWTEGKYFILNADGQISLRLDPFDANLYPIPSPSGDYAVGWPNTGLGPGGPPFFYDEFGRRNKWARAFEGDDWPAGLETTIVGISPRGSRVAVAARKAGKTTLFLFDAQGNRLWSNDIGRVAALLFSPDDRLLAYSVGEKIGVFNADGRPVWSQPDQVAPVRFSADGQTLLAKSQLAIRLFQSDSGRLIWSWEGTKSPIKWKDSGLPVTDISRWAFAIGDIVATPDFSHIALLGHEMEFVRLRPGEPQRSSAVSRSEVLLFDGAGTLLQKISVPREAQRLGLESSDPNPVLSVFGSQGRVRYRLRTGP